MNCIEFDMDEIESLRHRPRKRRLAGKRQPAQDEKMWQMV